MGFKKDNRIRELREARGISQRELGKIVGVSHASIQRYESGATQNMKYDTLEKMSNYFNVPPTYLLGWSDKREYVYNGDEVQPITTQTLPVLGEVSCGEPKYMENHREFYVKKGTEVKADFCLVCKGDSMIGARIYDGDIVFVRKQAMVENGEIAVVAIEDEATLKRVYYYEEKGMMQLVAENPKYAPIVVQGEDLNTVHVLGKAVAFQSDVE